MVFFVADILRLARQTQRPPKSADKSYEFTYDYLNFITIRLSSYLLISIHMYINFMKMFFVFQVKATYCTLDYKG
jgi:hypothetical protein